MADLDAIAAAALGCPLVADLTAGRFGEVATYGPGHRIPGVRLVEGEVELHVVAKWGVPLPEVADVLRLAVAPYAGGLPVAVFVDDIEVPGPTEEAAVAGP